MNPQKKNTFKLEDLKKENPFQVPENYFDSLGARIADRIEANSPREKEPVFTFATVRPFLAFAGGFASLALIVYMSFSFFFNKMGVENNQANTEIADLTEYSIVSELDEATLIETFTQNSSEVIDSLHLENRENIIDYLVEENIDISTIIDEL